MVANVGEITYTVDANTKPLLDASKDVDQSTKKMETDFNRVDRTTKKFGGGIKKLTQSFRVQKNAAQQLGFQFQDVAVQMQSGTRASVVFAQQGSQILGVFGPGGAIVGAILATSAAIGGSLVAALFDGGESIQDLEKKIAGLIGTLDEFQLREVESAIDSQKKRVAALGQEYLQLSNKIESPISILEKMLNSEEEIRAFRKKANDESLKESNAAFQLQLDGELELSKLIEKRAELQGKIDGSTERRKKQQKAKDKADRKAEILQARADAKAISDAQKGERKLSGVIGALGTETEGIRRKFEERNEIIQAQTEQGSALRRDLVLRNATLLLSDLATLSQKELDNERTKLEKLNKMRTEAFTAAAALQLGVSEETVERINAIADASANASVTLKDAWTNNMLDIGDAIGDTFARAIVDGESLGETLRGVAKSFLTEMLSSLIKVGAQMVINQAIGQAATVSSTAAAVAAGATTASAWAPAAAFASLASFGANAAPAAAGIASTVALSQGLALAGGKINGGPVGPGRMFPVAEDGRPEIFSDGNRQFLIPGSRGEVIGNKDMRGGGESAININFNVQNQAPGAGFEVTGVRQEGTEVTIDAIVSDIRTGNGPVSRALGDSTNVTRKSI